MPKFSLPRALTAACMDKSIFKGGAKGRDKLREHHYFTNETPYGTMRTYSDVQLKNDHTAVVTLKKN
jgi:hypothetical protein